MTTADPNATDDAPITDLPPEMQEEKYLSQDTKALHTWGWWSGRSELGFVALITVIATILLVGALNMEVLGEARPGPQFFPMVVAIILYLLAAALAVAIIRNPTYPDGQPHPGRGNYSTTMLIDLGYVADERTKRRYSKHSNEWSTYSDWKTLGMIVSAMVIFIVVLPFAGWIVSATFLFWVVAYALGARAGWVDLGIALLFASIIQLAFNGGLGLPLPAGFLEGLL